METKYDPKNIEPKWQKYWEEHLELFMAKDFSDKEKKFILVEFPYPSGDGLHVGHVRSYSALDVYSRKLRMQGFNVLYPIGWDAFGLPTENYAIKNKIHPSVATEKNISTFKRQMKNLGLSFDWSREINTTDPKYYKWTQWIFLKLLEKGLAYKAKMPINWCPSCKIGLANEEVIDGKCERCGTQTEKREKEQWMLAITKYADRLISDLDTVDYLEKIAIQQKNWIGKSEGAIIRFKITNSKEYLEVFTTRLDTIYGCTYMVIAPEHSFIKKHKEEIENYSEIEKYISETKKKSDLDRMENKDKTGVELQGIKAINPFTNEEVPIFVADYVLVQYGTGAVMAVPAHDERDFEFAKKYDLSIRQSIAPLFIGEGQDKIRDDKPNTERRVVDVIIKHWKEDKYYCLEWKYNGWKSFIVGGIEKGESAPEAALREAKEESGYKNMKVVRHIGGEIRSRFFAVHKDVNRKDLSRQCIFIELQDGEYEEPEEEHTKNHKGVWLEKEKIAAFLNLPALKIYWDIFLNGEKATTEDGIVINSGEYSGLTSEEARQKMTEWLEKNDLGSKKVNYKLRDWVFSRQHYWGEPIPVINCPKCGLVPLSEKDLPVELPMVESYEPTDTGESPLAKITDWVNVSCPKCGGPAKRETDTMPNWAGSSWYFLRYTDPQNSQELADQKKLKYWMPVDLYNGGMEHTTLHLLYSRFWNKFLFDIGVSPISEPYARRRSHGMVLAEDSRKMSKSFGNVINPDDIIKKFGADTLRIYEMFMGPFGEAIPWSTTSMVGAYRFLEKVYKLKSKVKSQKSKVQVKNKKLNSSINKTVKKVSEDIENLKFNTAVSSLMILTNEMEKEAELQIADYEILLKILSPFAPFISEELWSRLGHKESIFKEKWPEYDEKMIKDEEIDLIVQVNGRVRDRMKVSADISEGEAKKMALESEKVKNFVRGKEIKKIIYVKGRLVSIVI